MEGDIHGLLGWVGALAPPTIFLIHRSVNPGSTMTASGRYCRKKILRGSSSNIDSRRASNAQDRFKNPACAILLLRVVRVAPTFSTASARLRHAVMSAPCRLSGANRTHCAHFELSRS